MSRAQIWRRRSRTGWWLLAGLILASCAVRPPWPDPPADHPASPQVVAAPWEPPGAVLRAAAAGPSVPDPTAAEASSAVPPERPRPSHGGRR